MPEAPTSQAPARKEKWPPPPDPDRQVVPYWRIPVGLSSDFGPGASLTYDDDYQRIITYRHSSEKPPPKPKRHFLLEDVQKLEEWKREQQKLGPHRAAAAAMLKRRSAEPQPATERQDRPLEPQLDRMPVAVRFVELWQDEDGHKGLNGKSQEGTDGLPAFGGNEFLLGNLKIDDLGLVSDAHQPTDFSDTFEAIKRNEQTKADPAFLPYPGAFAIDTRTEYRVGNGQSENPLAELTRDLLQLSGSGDQHMLEITKTSSSDFHSGTAPA